MKPVLRSIAAIAAIAVMACTRQASAQMYIQNQDAFLDGDSLRLVFELVCSTYQHAYYVKITDDGQRIDTVSMQHYDTSQGLPVSVAIVINDDAISETYFDEIMEYLALVRPQLMNLRVIGTHGASLPVVAYNGNDSLFRIDMQSNILSGPARLLDGLTAAARELIKDETPLRLIFVVGKGFAPGRDSLMKEFIQTSKNYSINTQFMVYNSPPIKSAYYNWLAYTLGVSTGYTPMDDLLSDYMTQHTNYLNSYNKANMATFLRKTHNDGKTHTVVNQILDCTGNIEKQTNYRPFDDSVQYRVLPATMRVSVPNRINQPSIVLPIKLSDNNIVKTGVEPLLLYIRLKPKIATINDAVTDGSTACFGYNMFKGIGGSEAVIALKSDGDITKPNFAKLLLTMNGIVHPGETIIEEMKILSSDGRHLWSVETTTYDVTAPLPISADNTYPLCPGKSIRFSAMNGLVDYRWSTGATGQVITVTRPETVWYSAYDGDGVRRFSDTLAVGFFPPPNPFLNHPKDTTVCAENSSATPYTLETTLPFRTYEWSTGEYGRSIVVRSPGTYWVKVSDNHGCTATTDSVTVAILDPPEITLSASPAALVCNGTSVELRITAVTAQSIQWSTGEDGAVIHVTQPGDYYADVVDISGCVYRSDAIRIDVLPTPSPAIIGNSAACYHSMQRYTVAAPDPSNSYVWYAIGGIVVSGQDSPEAEIFWLDASYGTVRVEESNGTCTSIASSNVSLEPFNIPEVEVQGSPFLCPGESVQIATKDVFAAYGWSNGALTRSITVSTPGVYTVTTRDSAGCTGTSAPVVVVVHPAPAKPAITVEEQSLVAPKAVAYRWFMGGVPIGGETSQRLRVDKNGSYTVEVENEFGCSSISEPFAVDFVAVDRLLPAANEIVIYPTVVDDYFYLTGNTSGGKLAVELYNTLGIRVMQSHIDPDSPSVRIAVSGIPPGAYFVRIAGPSGVRMTKILKR